MKKNKLYTANKWNRPAFMPKEENIFLPGGSINLSPEQMQRLKLQNLSTNSGGGLPSLGVKMTPQLTTSSLGLGSLGKGGTGSLSASNPTEFFGLGSSPKGSNLLSAIGGLDGIMGAVGGMSTQVSDMLSGGHSSGAGNALRTAGGLVKNIPGLDKLGAVAELAGGAIDGLFGGPTADEAALKAAKEGTAAYKNYSYKNSLDNISGPVAQANVGNVYSNSVFGGGAAALNEALKRERKEARQFAFNSIGNNANNLISDQMNNALANFSAFGGPVESIDKTFDMGGALDYGLAVDDLNIYREAIQNKNKLPGMTPMPAFMPQRGLYAFGGDMQTNGMDWPTKLTHVDAGLSHEESPYDGVQMGIDPQGTPNLVEEGETIFDDYVYSARIIADAKTLEKFHLPKKAKMTYADITKKLEKQIKEREADPIAQAGFKAQMHALADEQERQKQEIEAERAREAFEALSPEEQTAIMQRAAQEEQMAQQAAVEQEAMAQQPSPEEMQMMQQQQAMQADGSQAMIGQEPPMMANGGHLYAGGSKIRRGVYKALGFHTDKEFLDWARKHKLRGNDTWEMNEGALKNLAEDDKAWQVLISDPTFAEAVKDNPALVHALANNYDFGAFTPDNTGNVTFRDISRGNWTAQDYEGWKESQDPAWLEAVEKGLVKEGMKQEDIAKALKQTDAYKRGSKWLQDSEDNRLRYLRTILEDENSPEVAKNYARKFIDANGWKKDAARDYESIFGANGKGVRETHPGTYWHTPVEATRGAQAQNWVINDDGSVEEIIGEVPTDWTAAGNYSWATPENDMTYNYYRRPSATASASPETSIAKTPEEKTEEFKKNVKPKYQHTMFGLGDLGPLAALTMQGLGIGRPDTSGLYAAANAAGNYTTADWMPRGDFAVYRPDDPWFYTSPILANSRATDRSIDNGGGNAGVKNAARLANAYQTNNALGNAARQQLDSNFDKYMKVKQFNGTIYDSNQKEFGQTSRFNASAFNDAARAAAQMKLHAASQQMDADAGWYNSLYGNVGNIFKNFEAHRQDNDRRNMIADMAANGIFGVITPDSPMGQRYLEWVNKTAEGGKIGKKKGKKGLTY